MTADLKKQIKKILYGYVGCESLSGTAAEKSAENFFLNYFKNLEYFKKHPEFCGAYPIKDDIHERAAAFAMVKGRGSDAVVLIHHNDVVGAEDFKTLKDFAFSPDALYKELGKIKTSLSEEARCDYESGEYLFGRGVCDMKGGGAIQMALLEHYSKQEDFEGTVIVLGVPDEENLSAGMRAGVGLLAQLKKKYGLNYRLMINSEPHQRRKAEEGVFSFGSIGKIMPYIYVRGCLAHAGKVFEGLNPVGVMAEIIRKTEADTAFSDKVGNEAAPPPTWLYLRENKESYDVSMPLTVNGCLSVLTLDSSPAAVTKKLKKICEEAFGEVILRLNRNYKEFLRIRGQAEKTLPWKAKVTEFGELYKEALKNFGNAFEEAYERKLEEIGKRVSEGKSSLITANFELVDFIFDYIYDLSPRIVIGLTPPYYPDAANIKRREEDEKIRGLYDILREFTLKTYGQDYTREEYYTGISDLSYSGIDGGAEIEENLRKNMPFFGSLYSLPVAAMEEISMPCVNIGPWGKDFHKLTERVLKQDLYERTPKIIDYAISKILADGGN